MFKWLYKTIEIDTYHVFVFEPLAVITRLVRRNSTTKQIVDERFCVRLPSWGYYYDICTDAERWGQLYFSWSTVTGKRGTFPIFI